MRMIEAVRSVAARIKTRMEIFVVERIPRSFRDTMPERTTEASEPGRRPGENERSNEDLPSRGSKSKTRTRFKALRPLRAMAWLAAAAVILAWGLIAFIPYPAERLDPARVSSRRFVDRNGEDLRIVPTGSGARLEWTGIDEMGPWIGPATVAIEDHRFESHGGIDPLGLARAVVTNLVERRLVAGGSTITQQLAKNLLPADRRGRTLARKIAETWDALRLERRLSKRQILEQYLNRVSYGSRAQGVTAAARQYFGKSPDRLTLSEAALLAGLPQAPANLSPYRHPERAQARQRLVLRRMRETGMISEADFRRALAEPLAYAAPEPVFRAEHFIGSIERGEFGAVPDGAEVRTTIDLALQTSAEGILRRHVERLAEKRVTQAAAVILDAEDGSILAWVGSTGFFDGSQVDGVTSLRQPGSTLKPFTYALAFERGMTGADLLADVPMEDCPDGYQPRNYDRDFHGPVRAREALACSYNVPAVRVLKDRVGVPALLEFLRRAGMTCLDREASHYGLALTLGAGEVRLLDLARAYGMLARGGRALEARAFLDRDPAEGERLLPEESAAQVVSILSDDNARRPAFGSGGPLSFGFPVAAKTGTSKDFRDNWTVGFTPRHVVAVWVGNFDGAPMRGVTGITGAAPLFHDLISLVGRGDGSFVVPDGLVEVEVCALSGSRPGPGCAACARELVPARAVPSEACGFHVVSGDRVATVIPAAYRPDGFRPM